MKSIEEVAERILPRISQNSQNFVLKLFSHRFHGRYCRKYTPTDFRSTQMGSFRGCTCLKCTNKAKKAPMKQDVQQQSRLMRLQSKKCNNRAGWCT